MASFERRLSKGKDGQMARAVLEYLQKKPAWWQDVLKARYGGREGKDLPLLIAVRNGYLNAYADGQSVLEIHFKRNGGEVQPRCKIHRKYVLGPEAGNGYLIFDELRAGDVAYRGPETLQCWINNALTYAGKEKRGVAKIVAGHSNVIDVEMGLPANKPVEPDAKKVASRMDIVTLEKDGEALRIVFYEAKLFDNPEIRAKNLEPKVLAQLQKYEGYVSDPVRREEVIDAYRNACKILCYIAEMRGTSAGSLVQEVAKNASLDLDQKPRLIVFGYKEGQISDKFWPRHKKALCDGGYPPIMEECAEGVRLGAKP